MFHNKSLSLYFFFATLMAVAACVKTDFDEPPTGGEPKTFDTNASIKTLKSKHLTSGGFDYIQDDLIVEGQVIMNDLSGNYYKTIVIQDSTGGIEVKFNDGYLVSRGYGIGRRVYIKCKGLYITDYNGLVQLTGSVVEENGVLSDFGITEVQERQVVAKGAYETPLSPRKLKITDFSGDKVSTLIQLDNVQFTPCDAGKTYAEAVAKVSLNRVVEDCNGKNVLLRTSGYANFAAQKTPFGNGSIIAVLSKYGSDWQLYIRDQNDIAMGATPDNRCGSNNNVPGTLMGIADVRALFTGTITKAPADKKIRGTVISDRLNKNLNNRNVYIQDGSGGIVVRFLAEHCFELGETIEVNISQMEISEFNGLRQVNNVPNENAIAVGSDSPLLPRETTIADINANFNAWESTLVKIANCTVTPAGILSGAKTVDDGTGTIAMFTQASSSLSGIAVPTGKVTLTAIVSDFNGKQIILRNAGDIK